MKHCLDKIVFIYFLCNRKVIMVFFLLIGDIFLNVETHSIIFVCIIKYDCFLMVLKNLMCSFVMTIIQHL